jgi:tryptophanyl-tRNA synthetase
MRCLIPCAIDQDPYFRMTRDVASKIFDGAKCYKPSLIHSIFFPSLLGPNGKMSSGIVNSAIFVTDNKEQIKKKVGRAPSGGQETMELQRELGADLEVDVAYQWLRFFEPSDEKLKQIGYDYSSGKLLTGDVKKVLVALLQGIAKEHQDARALVTDEMVEEFMSVRPLEF